MLDLRLFFYWVWDKIVGLCSERLRSITDLPPDADQNPRTASALIACPLTDHLVLELSFTEAKG
jgi:hypothetical protein